MKNTYLYQIPETSDFMMSFVLITKKGNAVIIDGGRPEDMPSLKRIVGNRPVIAWILTHPHIDHISGFNELVATDSTDLVPEKVYYRFPSAAFARETEPGEAHTLDDFYAIYPKIADKSVLVKEGDVFHFDELTVTCLLTFEEDHPINNGYSTLNEASAVFRVDGDRKRVLFLGDIGPDGGDRLYERHWRELACDYVQVAHHGHSGPGAEVYLAASPKAAFWCGRDWLYDEAPNCFGKRLYGTKMQRMWLEKLGVKKNYVTKDGLHRVIV